MSAEGRWRASAVSLAYVDATLGRDFYVFRVDGGVFETDAPGLADGRRGPPVVARQLGLARVDGGARAGGRWQWRGGGALRLDALTASPYADSLYAVFGRPERPAGVVGASGRAAGRLGEYVARVTRSRSIPRGWAARPSSDTPWPTSSPTAGRRARRRSSRRCGRASPRSATPVAMATTMSSEHQAEAAAFAVHFLLATATARDPEGELGTLDHYELLVPGTRTLARYFAMQAAFGGHPLRAFLTTGRMR